MEQKKPLRRKELSPQSAGLLEAARHVAKASNVDVVVLLADVPYDFKAIGASLRRCRLIVASGNPDVQRAVREDDIPLVPLSEEPQTRQDQLSQALVEAVADELVKTGDRVVALYAGFEPDVLDSLSVIYLGGHLTRLTARDLQRLETHVPLKTLRRVVDLAVEIGREGREGHPVGTIFVVGDHRKVLQLSHEAIHDCFRGYGRKERMLSNPRVRESIKEVAQVDGAFIITADGEVRASGRILDAPAEGLTLSKGLGARHWAAAAITKATKAVAIVVSQSTGTVRIFQDGKIVLRIEPKAQAMKWYDIGLEPPAASTG